MQHNVQENFSIGTTTAKNKIIQCITSPLKQNSFAIGIGTAGYIILLLSTNCIENHDIYLREHLLYRPRLIHMDR